MKQTKISNPYIAVIARIDSGEIAAMAPKAAKTLITACPAIMLPARRIEWLTGRTKYEITSIKAKIGRSARGADETQNSPKNPTPFNGNR